MLVLCRQELSRLAEDLRELPSLLFVGLPVSLHGVTVSAMAALRQGELLGFVLPPSVPEGPLPEGFLPASAVFEAGGAGAGVPGCDAGKALQYGSLAGDCDCLLLPCYEPARVGSADRAEQALSCPEPGNWAVPLSFAAAPGRTAPIRSATGALRLSPKTVKP